ncbi:MAG: DUF975 family protein [Candidatus Moraniibacteriota bacterium]
MDTFRVGEAVRFGWETFKTHFLFLWMIFGSVWGISLVFSLLQKGAGKETSLGTLIGLVAIVLGFIVQLGLIRMYLDLAEGTEDKLAVLFSQHRLIWRYLGAALLYGLMVALGLALLIIPGIYWALKYQFFSYLIVDKNLGVLDALKKSATMTEGVKWKLLGFALVLCGLNILGALALVLGLLVTIPVSIIAYVYVYRALAKRSFNDALISENAVPTKATA